MSKYIIEIEDEPFGRNDDPNIPHGMDELYRAKGFNALVFDQNGLDKLTPLDKELEEAYQKGLDEAWKAITKIAKMPDGERMTHFGEVWISNILNAYSLDQIFTILEKSEFEPQNNCSTCRHDSDSLYCRGCKDYKLWQPKGDDNCDTCKHQNNPRGVKCRNCYDQILYQWEPKEGAE